MAESKVQKVAKRRDVSEFPKCPKCGGKVILAMLALRRRKMVRFCQGCGNIEEKRNAII